MLAYVHPIYRFLQPFLHSKNPISAGTVAGGFQEEGQMYRLANRLKRKVGGRHFKVAKILSHVCFYRSRHLNFFSWIVAGLSKTALNQCIG